MACKTILTKILPAMMAGLCCALASAQTNSVPAQQFQPPPGGGDNYIQLMGHDVAGHLKPAFGLYFNYAYQPLAFTQRPSGKTINVIKDLVGMDAMAALGFFDVLELGVAMPVGLYQRSDAGPGTAFQGKLSATAVGDLRIVPKWRFYHDPDRGGLALAVVVTAPTGKASSMQGNRALTLEPKVAFDWRFNQRIRMGLNLGYIVRNMGSLVKGQQKLANVDVGNELTYGAALELTAVLNHLSFIGEVFGKMAADTKSALNVETVPLEGLIGPRWHIGRGHALTAAAGMGLTDGYGSPTARVVLGYTYSPPRDTDGDGCYDVDDPCPLDPEDVDGFEDSDCCPDADNDKDGICDPWVADKRLADKYKATCRGRDQCPDIPEDFDGFEDEDGCPDPDNDKDKICDPWVMEKGLADKYKTECQGRDQCPMIPENYNGYQDDDGCPDQLPEPPKAKIEGKKIIILEPVLFYFDKTVIKPESSPVLNAVVKVLNDNPQIRKIRIEGHTDSSGSDAYNMELSSGRAKAIYTYLIEHGIAPDRLTYQQFGKRRLLVYPEKGPTDTQKNRRVEFIIIETAEPN